MISNTNQHSTKETLFKRAQLSNAVLNSPLTSRLQKYHSGYKQDYELNQSSSEYLLETRDYSIDNEEIAYPELEFQEHPDYDFEYVDYDTAYEIITEESFEETETSIDTSTDTSTESYFDNLAELEDETSEETSDQVEQEQANQVEYEEINQAEYEETEEITNEVVLKVEDDFEMPEFVTEDATATYVVEAQSSTIELSSSLQTKQEASQTNSTTSNSTFETPKANSELLENNRDLELEQLLDDSFEFFSSFAEEIEVIRLEDPHTSLKQPQVAQADEVDRADKDGHKQKVNHKYPSSFLAQGNHESDSRISTPKPPRIQIYSSNNPGITFNASDRFSQELLDAVYAEHLSPEVYEVFGRPRANSKEDLNLLSTTDYSPSYSTSNLQQTPDKESPSLRHRTYCSGKISPVPSQDYDLHNQGDDLTSMDQNTSKKTKLDPQNPESRLTSQINSSSEANLAPEAKHPPKEIHPPEVKAESEEKSLPEASLDSTDLLKENPHFLQVIADAQSANKLVPQPLFFTEENQPILAPELTNSKTRSKETKKPYSKASSLRKSTNSLLNSTYTSEAPEHAQGGNSANSPQDHSHMIKEFVEYYYQQMERLEANTMMGKYKASRAKISSENQTNSTSNQELDSEVNRRVTERRSTEGSSIEGNSTEGKTAEAHGVEADVQKPANGIASMQKLESPSTLQLKSSNPDTSSFSQPLKNSQKPQFSHPRDAIRGKLQLPATIAVASSYSQSNNLPPKNQDLRDNQNLDHPQNNVGNLNLVSQSIASQSLASQSETGFIDYFAGMNLGAGIPSDEVNSHIPTQERFPVTGSKGSVGYSSASLTPASNTSVSLTSNTSPPTPTFSDWGSRESYVQSSGATGAVSLLAEVEEDPFDEHLDVRDYKQRMQLWLSDIYNHPYYSEYGFDYQGKADPESAKRFDNYKELRLQKYQVENAMEFYSPDVIPVYDMQADVLNHIELDKIYPTNNRVIFHIDINSCYASIESMLDPSLKGKPVAVGGNAVERKGIIVALSKEAKAFGIRVGDHVSIAQIKCPEIRIVHPKFKEYRHYTNKVKAIIREYSDHVESMGIDEAWADLTHTCRHFGTPWEVATEIRQRIWNEVGISVSIGISFCKIFAKLGSDMDKFNGVFEIPYRKFKDIVWPLKIDQIIGIGRKISRKLFRMGVVTVGDLAQMQPDLLEKIFGIGGKSLWMKVNGYEFSTVRPSTYYDPPKSVSHGTTFATDLTSNQQVKTSLKHLATDLSIELIRKNVKGRNLGLSIRDNKLKRYQVNLTLEQDVFNAEEISNLIFAGFQEQYSWQYPIRAMTIRIGRLSPLYDEYQEYDLSESENAIIQDLYEQFNEEQEKEPFEASMNFPGFRDYN